MSALALLTHSLGYVVGGSDLVKNSQTNKLKSISKIFVGHSKDNVASFKPDLVVYTGAVKDTNPELVYCRETGIPTIERSEYLGNISAIYDNVIAIAGTHGKTTTTAMIGNIFRCAGLNPTIHVGGECLNFGSNVVLGSKRFFITEACEYKRSFECLKPACGVVTNIECDHMDCYQDYNDLKQSFVKFLDNSNMCILESGTDIVNKISTKYIYSFGEHGANYEAKNIEKYGVGFKFDIYENGEYLANFKLNIMGEYNVKNALVAISVARVFDISVTDIYDGLNTFLGVERRNENIGKIGNTVVYADYCHHPTEIHNSIKNFKDHFSKILCVFQPHTYSRTVALLREFLECFGGVEKLIIFKTYAAREEYNYIGSETNLYNNIKLKNKELIIDKLDLINRLKTEAKNYDCVIVLGAGDIYNIVKNEFGENK